MHVRRHFFLTVTCTCLVGNSELELLNLKPVGLRKGVWSEEEDDLLRKCILKYGEGRWHLVPFQAGLNRCRKSCRQRWLNYLKPNINRGEFRDDEVDLIIKLHKLLGNRWTLIAGRLPGRTDNDIKNYWNTYLNSKKVQPIEKKKKKKKRIRSSTPATIGVKGKNVDTESNNISMKTVVFKPRPRTFSKSSLWEWKDTDASNNNQVISEIKPLGSACDININDQNHVSAIGSINKEVLISDKWWENFLFDKEEETNCDHEKHILTSDWWWEYLLSVQEDYNEACKREEGGKERCLRSLPSAFAVLSAEVTRKAISDG